MIAPRIGAFHPYVGNDADGEPFVYFVVPVSWVYEGTEYGFSIISEDPTDKGLEEEIWLIAQASQMRLGQT